MPSKDQYLNISTSTIVRFFIVFGGIFFLYLIRDILAALLFAIIIASAMEPALEWLKAYRIPRVLGVVIIYLGIAAFLFSVFYLIFPLLLEEFRAVSSLLSLLRERALERIEGPPIPLSSLFSGGAEELFHAPSRYLERITENVFDFVGAVFGGAFSFIIIIVFSFYLGAQEQGIEKFLRLITPLPYEPYVVNLWKRSQRTLGRWLRAQLLLGAVVGVLTFFGLTFLGVRNALLLASLAAILEIVPVVGPILAAIPAIMIALISSPVLGASTAILYFIVQQVESHVIIPVVMRRAVGLSPLIVVLSLLIGAKIGGILGILLAVPITAVAVEILNDWDRKKRELVPGEF